MQGLGGTARQLGDSAGAAGTVGLEAQIETVEIADGANAGRSDSAGASSSGTGGAGAGQVEHPRPPSTEALSQDDREQIGLTTKMHPPGGTRVFRVEGYGCSPFSLPLLPLT